MGHSERLKDTKLWQVYVEKLGDDHNRMRWTQKAVNTACEQLKAVRDTFENYTLHDDTHVLNVMDIMAGLLGNRIKELTVGEAEALLIVAALHDLGMVYTKTDRETCLTDTARLRKYYASHPDLRNTDVEEWDESVQQDFLRWLHPFRIMDVLQQEEWKNHFEERPKEVISQNVIVAICRAHGENVEEIRLQATVGELKYLCAKEVDPLFCAILLRLADIMDFDDSRTPAILFSYAGGNKKSVEEWEKHISSLGFNFHDIPSSADLPYSARFSSPIIERSARRFLDWIDEELSNSRSLLAHTCERWKDFCFPYKVDRNEIERIGYVYGDFRISMDQERIMDLLIGGNLYKDRSVFVRELLQNSIDATLLRAEMDSSFTDKLDTDEARIDFWEWYDDEGSLWFRIDDRGTGMTLGMLEKYFLKAGRSYYNSEELKRELNGKSYSSISRFGIGFLSSFLCGEEAYVSTTYWNPEKNKREADKYTSTNFGQEAFGLRLDVVGLTGYYTLRSQAIYDNRPDTFPTPPKTVPRPDDGFEKEGYRTTPGTSIAIRIEPGKLGANSLKDTAKKWAFFPRMPIYYNGERLCMTQEELTDLVGREQGVREYELSETEKSTFDSLFQEIKGNYPKMKVTIDLFDAESEPRLSKLKIMMARTEVLFENNKKTVVGQSGWSYTGGSKLGCPAVVCEDGDGNEIETLDLGLKDNRRSFTVIDSVSSTTFSEIVYGWKGISVIGIGLHADTCTAIVLDDNEKGPKYKLDRDCGGTDDVLDVLPFKSYLTILSWARKYSDMRIAAFSLAKLERINLKTWKTAILTGGKSWIDAFSWDEYLEIKHFLENGVSSYNKNATQTDTYIFEVPFTRYIKRGSYFPYLHIAYMQLHCRIVVEYSDQRQRLSISELDSNESETQFDLFPLMLFAYGKTDKDRIFLCSAKVIKRRAITADHLFSKWLLKNADKLCQYYPLQFNKIVHVLLSLPASDIISVVKNMKKELAKTAFRYGINILDCPELTECDFW